MSNPCERLPCQLLEEYPTQLFWFGRFKNNNCPCCGATMKNSIDYDIPWYYFKLKKLIKGWRNKRCNNCKSIFVTKDVNIWVKVR